MKPDTNKLKQLLISVLKKQMFFSFFKINFEIK